VLGRSITTLQKDEILLQEFISMTNDKFSIYKRKYLSQELKIS